MKKTDCIKKSPNLPQWHAAELEAREKLYSSGKLPVFDWEDVKARLQARIKKT